jgi:LuxR family glucitol operon transcriptional activator
MTCLLIFWFFGAASNEGSMAYGVVRLTLYALISAIESDLREAIGNNLLVEWTPKDLLPQVIYERAYTRMVRDTGFAPDSDAGIIEYLDFSESIEVLSSSKIALSGPLASAVKRIANNASVLVPIRNRVMHSRPLEYDDLAHVSNLASDRHSSSLRKIRLTYSR